MITIDFQKMVKCAANAHIGTPTKLGCHVSFQCVKSSKGSGVCWSWMIYLPNTNSEIAVTTSVHSIKVSVEMFIVQFMVFDSYNENVTNEKVYVQWAYAISYKQVFTVSDTNRHVTAKYMLHKQYFIVINKLLYGS